MYSIEKVIKSVSEYKVYKNYLGYKDTASLKEKTLYLNGKPISNAITEFSFFNKKLFFSNWNNEVFKYDLVTGNIIKTEYKQVSVLSDSNKLILKKDNLFSDILLFNNKIYTIKNELIVMKSYIHNELLFNANGHISSYHIPTAHPLWQFDLSQLGTFQDYHNEQQSYKVEKILGIHNEHLYVALNGSLLLELDIATGKITHKWHHLPEKYKEYPDDDFSARLFDLDKANNALVCLSGRRYDSIDLQTKEYNSVYIGEELKKSDIVSIRHQGDFTNEHISAVAHLKNDTWFQDGIVMFNRKTNKIDFFYKDETFTTGTATPKLAGNKLYQLDLDGNLYIFEKGENNIQT